MNLSLILLHTPLYYGQGKVLPFPQPGPGKPLLFLWVCIPGSFDMLCICHECSYMQGYTHFSQFFPGSCFCIEAHKNSRLAERKTKQVFTINHIVCKRAWQTGTKNTTLYHRENFKIPFLRCQPTSVLQQAFSNLPLLGWLC